MRLRHSLAFITVSAGIAAWTLVAVAHPGEGNDHDHVYVVDQPALKNNVTIEVKDGFRHILSNGIPDHKPGQFPNRGNPHTIAPQTYKLRVPVKPTMLEKNAAAPVQRGLLVGVALNGVVFDPGTAEYWRNDPRTGWRQEAISPMTNQGARMGLDTSNAHVQPNGSYHYHALPIGLVENLAAAGKVKIGATMIQIGWAADGFPIYETHGHAKADDAKSPLKELRSSYKLKKGERPGGDEGPGGKYDGAYTQDFEYVAGSGDLDECNGRTGVTPEFPGGTYYYVVTDQFPFIPRQLKGAADASFQKNDRPGGRPGPGPGPGPRPGGPGPRPAPPGK